MPRFRHGQCCAVPWCATVMVHRNVQSVSSRQPCADMKGSGDRIIVMHPSEPGWRSAWRWVARSYHDSPEHPAGARSSHAHANARHWTMCLEQLQTLLRLRSDELALLTLGCNRRDAKCKLDTLLNSANSLYMKLNVGSHVRAKTYSTYFWVR
jgi:hypothetical protein